MKIRLIYLAMAIVFTACNSKTAETVELQPEQISDEIIVSKSQFDAMKMELGEVTERRFDKIIKANGIVEAENSAKATVSSYFGGVVGDLPWKVGSYIKKGQLLFTLSSTEIIDLQKDYLDSRAQLEYLKTEADRQEILAKENAVAAKLALKAKSDHAVMFAQHKSIKEKLGLLNISLASLESGMVTNRISVYAPISGYISEIHIQKGSYLAPTESAMLITNTDQLFLTLQVFEKDILHIKQGQSINFILPTNNNKRYEAEVLLVGKYIESDKRVIPVQGKMKQRYAELIPGMYVEASIISDKRNLPALPDASIISEGDASVVFILSGTDESNYIFKKTVIFTGESMDGYTAVVNDKISDKGHKILIKGAYDILTI